MKTENSTNPYQAELAVQLCNVAGDINPVKDIGQLVPGWKIVWTTGDYTNPNYSFVAVDPTGNTYVLITRGSVSNGQEFSDWDIFVDWILEDLNDVLVPWGFTEIKGAAISAGVNIVFTGMLLERNGLDNGKRLHEFLIENTTAKGKQLIIAGHSLGGNLSKVYASYYVGTLMLLQLPTDNVSLVTFAAPASGNSEFVKDLENKIPSAWHYRNLHDAVPAFPTEQGLIDTSNSYIPAPLAAACKIGDTKVTLQEVFLGLAAEFKDCDYQQATKNYITFKTPLFPQFPDSSVKSWLGQAGMQHQLYNYANYLGVTLPVVHSQNPVAVPQAL